MNSGPSAAMLKSLSWVHCDRRRRLCRHHKFALMPSNALLLLLLFLFSMELYCFINLIQKRSMLWLLSPKFKCMKYRDMLLKDICIGFDI